MSRGGLAKINFVTPSTMRKLATATEIGFFPANVGGKSSEADT